MEPCVSPVAFGSLIKWRRFFFCFWIHFLIIYLYYWRGTIENRTIHKLVIQKDLSYPELSQILQVSKYFPLFLVFRKRKQIIQRQNKTNNFVKNTQTRKQKVTKIIFQVHYICSPSWQRAQSNITVCLHPPWSCMFGGEDLMRIVPKLQQMYRMYNSGWNVCSEWMQLAWSPCHWGKLFSLAYFLCSPSGPCSSTYSLPPREDFCVDEEKVPQEEENKNRSVTTLITYSHLFGLKFSLTQQVFVNFFILILY